MPEGKKKIVKTPAPKKKGWFKKIPTDVLLSPAGMILIIFALIMEILDLIPVPVIDQIWEIPLEIIFMILLVKLAHVSLKSCVVPFFAERIIGIVTVGFDFIPTWLIRMLV